MVIAITHSGYIKSLPLATYRQQKRGGVGVTGMDMKDDDYIEHLFVCSTHDYLLFFTNRGKVYRQKVYELPEASRTAKGRALVNLLPLREGERVRAVHGHARLQRGQVPRLRDHARAMIKKTEFLAYNTPIKADGIIAIKHPRRRRARRRAPDQRRRRHHHGLALGPGGALQRGRRCGRWAATPAACAGMNVVAEGTTRCSRWTSRATTPSCSS